MSREIILVGTLRVISIVGLFAIARSLIILESYGWINLVFGLVTYFLFYHKLKFDEDSKVDAMAKFLVKITPSTILMMSSIEQVSLTKSDFIAIDFVLIGFLILDLIEIYYSSRGISR